MKLNSKISFLFLVCVMAGCSSAQQGPVPIQLSANGPTVINARPEPGVIVLNSDMQPMNPAQVIADVKDFKSRVTDVRLKFLDVPLEVPMENIGGTAWRAELTPQELQMLAVSGKTVKYRAIVVAKNANGDKSPAMEPLFVAVKAPQRATYG